MCFYVLNAPIIQKIIVFKSLKKKNKWTFLKDAPLGLYFIGTKSEKKKIFNSETFFSLTAQSVSKNVNFSTALTVQYFILFRKKSRLQVTSQLPKKTFFPTLKITKSRHLYTIFLEHLC